jgi:hypothetical protein
MFPMLLTLRVRIKKPRSRSIKYWKEGPTIQGKSFKAPP